MIVRLFILIGCIQAQQVSPGTQAELESRFRSEYPRAAEALESMAGGVLAKGRQSQRWLSGNTTSSDLLVGTSSGRRAYVTENRSLKGSSGGSRREENASKVLCETPELRFTLERKQGAGDYTVTSYAGHVPDEDSAKASNFKLFTRGATVYFGISLADRIADPSFVLKSIEPRSQDGIELIRINYEYKGKFASEAGLVDLAPGRGWAIQRAEVACTSNKDGHFSTLIHDVNYADLGEACCFPSRVESTQRFKSDLFETKTVEYGEVSPGAAPARMFALTGYGLPEIPLRSAPRRAVFTFRNPLFWASLVGTILSFILLRISLSHKPGSQQQPYVSPRK